MIFVSGTFPLSFWVMGFFAVWLINRSDRKIRKAAQEYTARAVQESKEYAEKWLAATPYERIKIERERDAEYERRKT